MSVANIDFRGLSAGRGLSTGLQLGSKLGQQYRDNRIEDDELARQETQRQIDDAARDAAIALEIKDPIERDRFLGQRQIRAEGYGDGSDTAQFREQLRGLSIEQQDNELRSILSKALPVSTLAKSAGYGSSDAKMQFGGQELLKDEAGNYFYGTSVRDPSKGNVGSSLVPVSGGDIQPIGKLSPVNGAGLTSQEDLAHSKEKLRGKLEAETNAATDKKFKEKIGEEGAQVYSTLQKAAQSASAFIPRLEALRTLANKVETGTGAEVALAAKKALGIDSADMEELNAKLGELAQDILNQQTGTKTDFDFQNAVRQSASLGKTPEANVRLINALIERQQQAVNFADQAQKAYDDNGVKGVLDMRYSAPSAQGGGVASPANIGRFKIEVAE